MTVVTDTLQGKAKLLLRRERELYELRLLRGRAEQWLRALHAVWPEGLDLDLPTLARRVTDLLVGSLSFEMAALFEYHREKVELVFGCSDPHALPVGMQIEAASADYLEAHPVGRYDPSECAPLSSLAAQLDYAKFFWRWSASYRGSRFLFLAGASPRTAQFHTFSDTDRDHFAMFTSHAAALLSNSFLVADIQRERAEIELANRGLDTSLHELRETQAKLVASTQIVALASRQAGMAEIATGVLHNVGNVLNSVNVCSEAALQQASELPVANLERLAELLESQESISEFFRVDPRAAQSIAYLREIARRLAAQRGQLVSELSQLGQHLGHVKAIVSHQQTYAKNGSVERCALPEVMEEALLLARSSHQRGRVDVVREFGSVPEISIDRHRVLQILVNLISNALRALEDSEQAQKRLVARIGTGPSGTVRLAIADNGVGISAENAPRLFQHGFTTRKGGHGFGLHTSALTANELGGALSFESAGSGRGATFTLQLPSSGTALSPPDGGPHGFTQAPGANNDQHR